MSDGGCSVTAPLGCDVMMTDDKCEWLFYLACREREHIAIYALRAPPSRQCRIVTLHAGDDVNVSRVQPPTTPCSVGWSQSAPPHEPMSRTGLLKKG